MEGDRIDNPVSSAPGTAASSYGEAIAENQAWEDGRFATVYRGTVVGYQRIAVMEEGRTTKLRVRILDARVAVTVAFLGVY